MGKKRPNANTWAKIRGKYLEGAKIADLEREFEVKADTIRKRATREAWRGQKQGGLTDKQQRFIFEYLKSFNATQAYLTAYGGKYQTARANSHRLLINADIKAEIDRQKAEITQELRVELKSLARKQIQVAMADYGNYAEWGTEERQGKDGKTYTANYLRLKDSDSVDSSLVKSVTTNRGGVALELLDQSKAMEWLGKYLESHAESTDLDEIIDHQKEVYSWSITEAPPHELPPIDE